jgi:uncharacterized membrane protein YdjX (TVP38/TMEM64 family)/rhodanese-related sulfurtransferase
MKSGLLLRLSLALLLAAAVALAFFYRDRLNIAALDSLIKNAGFIGPVLFMLVYALATILFLPGSVLTLAGGALFGPVWGTFYNLTGATVGATLAFLAARYLASDWVSRRAGGRMKQLIDGVEKEGWHFVAFARLVPLFPFNLLNYAFGLTRIRLGHFIIASYLFMLPGAIAYTYLGYAGREAMAGGEGLIQKGLLALALLAVVAFLPRFIRRLRKTPDAAGTAPTLSVKELKQRLDTRNNILVLDVRSAEEYHGPLGHIAGSRHIAISELPKRLAELEDYRDRTIAVVCRTDRRSAKAMEHMCQTGFKNILLVPGGMEAWNREGFPVERQ